MRESEEVENLYSLDPGEFTAARNALVSGLKGEGRLDEAAEVAALRRPPFTAWALNRVAQEHGALVEAVLASGRGLRAATSRALEGDRSELTAAHETERAAIDTAVVEACHYLEMVGHRAGDSARRRMAETLRAATVDESVAQLLMHGTLDGDKNAIGFDFSVLPASATEPTGRRRSSKGARSNADARDDDRSRIRLVGEVDRRRKTARAAHDAAAAAKKDAERLSRLASTADRELAEAEHRLHELPSE